MAPGAIIEEPKDEQTVVIQTKADLLQPKTDPIEPHIDAIEDQTDPIESNIDVVQPEADPIELKTDVAQPEAVPIEPEIDSVEPKTESVQPEVASVVPEIVSVEPKPEEQPVVGEAKIDPVETPAESIELKTDPTEAKVDSAEPKIHDVPVETDSVQPTADAVQLKTDSRSVLYKNVNQEELKSKISKYLLYYGVNFIEDIIVGTEGLYVYTASGRKVLDWTSGQMSCLLGHGHPEIAKVISDHASSLDHLFSGMMSPPVISLAERLCETLPDGLDKAFFLSTGGESNEAAIKMAKVYTGKFEIVGLGASWHGMTAQALATQYHYGRKGQGPTMPGMLMLPCPNAYRSPFRKPDGSYDWEAELDFGWQLIDMQSCGSLAACIIEVIQSSGGMHVLPPGYLKALKKHCEKRGMLLIDDEAQTGLGRCGGLLAADYDGVVPDILTLSKTLGNGLPLSAVVTSAEIEKVCIERDYCFYTTHVNDPLPASVGGKVLEIVLRDNLIEKAAKLGEILHSGLKKLQDQYGCIGDVRGRGLMAGVEIVKDRETKAPALALAKKVGDRAYELGVWANLSSHESFGGTFRICPPITITEAQLKEGLDIIGQAFSEIEGTMPLY